MSFRESLTHLKGKMKKGLHIRSRSATPTASSLDLPRTSSDAHSDSTQLPIPKADTIDTPGNSDIDSAPGVPTTLSTTHPSGTASIAWSGVKTLLAVLESSSDAFGPLKSAVGGFNKCINIYERAAKGRNDYNELRDKLDGLLQDLAGYVSQPMDPLMTNSVKLLCTSIESELKNVEDKRGRSTGRRLAEAMDTQDEILECYRRIHGYLERVTLNANMNMLGAINDLSMESRLAKMSPAMSAVYDSAASTDLRRGNCAPGTRVQQIDFLLEWARDPKAGNTCWMNGMAGTGKTTIAYTVCAKLENTFELGASFFCSRVIPECRRVENIIPSIAYQLARFSLPFYCVLDKSLKSNRDAHTRTLKIQYQKLIVEPLMEVQESVPSDFIVVIDALDECENDNSLGEILDLLMLSAVALPIRFMISSRPESAIYRRMMGRVDEQGNRRLVLHNLNTEAVKSDIEAYMRHELDHIFLTDTQWSGILERCGVLFIYASTACRLIQQGDEMNTLDEAIKVIAGSELTSAHEDKNTIDELYSMILTAAFHQAKMSQANKHRMRELLETAICAIEPMNLESLAVVLRLKDAKQANALLHPLRSVLNVTNTGHVTTLHASFPDFMFSSSRSVDFYCVAARRHTALVECCLQIIDNIKPKFNICGLSSSFLSDNMVEDMDKRVDQGISHMLIYACRYWSTHLFLGEVQQQLVGVIQRFFTQRLLLWMEILNLTKRMRFGTGIIRDAGKWCQSQAVPNDLSKLVHDAEQFVSVYANHPISESTPHIYISMLAFWPESRPVSMVYMSRTSGILRPTGTAIARRQPALLATWRVSDGYVGSISLSLNGSQIAAATKDTVVLLDISTGEEILHIQTVQTKGVRVVLMSPDSSQVIFASESGLYLLDVKSEAIQETSNSSSIIWSIAFLAGGSQFACGREGGDVYIYPLQKGYPVLDPLQSHTDCVRSITFSPDGLFLASGLYSQVQVWDVQSGRAIGSLLEGHTNLVMSLSYSPDGTRLASASRDKTIRVWDPLRGQTILGPLTGHSNWVRSVTFSPDGAFIASGSDDRTIQVYDAHTGQTVLGPLEGHTGNINSVIFSPDSMQLFSCSDDGTIRLWNVHGLDAPNSSCQAFPNGFLSVRFSPDGSQVVSGSYDGSVCIWDVQTGEMVLGPLKGHSGAIIAVDFSPNGAYIASASQDFTMRIWNTQDGRDLHGPMQEHMDEVNCIQFSPDGSLLVSGLNDKTVWVWDVTSGQPAIEPLKGHSNSVDTVAFSPNGALVVSGSFDCTIRVWDIQSGQTVVGPLQGHQRQVTSVAFSPDGSKILSGSWDGSIRTWDAQTGQQLLVWDQDQGDINSVAFSPNALLIVSGSGDKSTCIWDAQTGDLKLNMKGYSICVHSVQFSSDGSHVVSCSYNGTIQFWDASSRIGNLQLKTSKGLGEADISNDSAFGPWSLDSDGWLVDQQQQKLVWVPEDLRISTPQHANDLVFCKQGSLKLSFDRVNIGKQWSNC
ncbi:vegetative incompatibility protein HET-E-1, partial [Rhizoctonia solani 123E]